jgi:hypothetical protein
LCCVCCKDDSMERKVTWRTKGFKQYKNGSKGKNPRQTKKKFPPGAWMSVFVSVVCCHVEVSATGLSLVQRSHNECGVSECDLENSIMRRPWLTRGCCAIVKNIYLNILLLLYGKDQLLINNYAVY